MELFAIDERFLPAYDATMQAISKAIEGSLSAGNIKACDGGEDDDDEMDYLVEYTPDNIAMVEISGMLTDRYSHYNRYFGVVSYQEIQAVAHQAVNKQAKGMLVKWNSVGGLVSGMRGCAETLASLPFPTMSYCASKVCSAAYELASQLDQFYVDSLAEVGSIGVVCTVMDYSKSMEMNGVRAVRFRSGDLKQAGSPYFKLTDKEKAMFEESVMYTAGLFYQDVANSRGIPLEMLDTLGITSGKNFIGKQAVDVGLADQITTFEQACATLCNKAVDKSRPY